MKGQIIRLLLSLKRSAVTLVAIQSGKANSATPSISPRLSRTSAPAVRKSTHRQLDCQRLRFAGRRHLPVSLGHPSRPAYRRRSSCIFSSPRSRPRRGRVPIPDLQDDDPSGSVPKGFAIWPKPSTASFETTPRPVVPSTRPADTKPKRRRRSPWHPRILFFTRSGVTRCPTFGNCGSAASRVSLGVSSAYRPDSRRWLPETS